MVAARISGKTTLALSVAAELAESGKRVFLLDADTWAPSLDLQLGLAEHPAGLAAACRLVAQERFDQEQLERLSTPMSVGAGSLTVMTGLSSESRWAEVSAEKLDDLIMVASNHFDFVVLDVGSPISPALVSLASPVERNAVSRWAVTYSDKVIAVCGADPVSVARFLTSYSELTELSPKGRCLHLSIVYEHRCWARRQSSRSLRRLQEWARSRSMVSYPMTRQQPMRPSRTRCRLLWVGALHRPGLRSHCLLERRCWVIGISWIAD